MQYSNFDASFVIIQTSWRNLNLIHIIFKLENLKKFFNFGISFSALTSTLRTSYSYSLGTRHSRNRRMGKIFHLLGCFFSICFKFREYHSAVPFIGPASFSAAGSPPSLSAAHYLNVFTKMRFQVYTVNGMQLADNYLMLFRGSLSC